MHNQARKSAKRSNAKRRNMWISILLVLVLAIVGCNSDSGSASPSPTPRSTGTATATPAEPPIEISWHGSFQLDALLPNSYVQQIIEERFNVKIEFVNARMDRLNLLAASGDLPDVMRIADPSDVATLGGSGVLLELSLDMLEEKIPEIVASVNEVDVSLWGLSNFDGVNYAIPQYLTVVPWDHAIAWRQDVLDAAGIASTPQTIAEYDSAFRAIKDNEQQIIAATNGQTRNLYGFSASDVQHPWNGFSWLFGAYGSMPGSWQLDADGRMARGETLPGTRDALIKLNEWYTEGYIDPAFVTDQGEQWDSKFVQGAYSMITISMDGIVRRDPDSLQQAIPTVEYAVVPVPVGPGGDQGIWSWGHRQNFVALSASLEDQPEKLDKIMEILHAVATDEELYLLTHWGEEGRSYRLEDGVPVVIPPYDDDKTPEVNALGTGTLGASGGLFGPFGTVDIINKFIDPSLVEASETYARGKPDILYMLPLPSTPTVDQRIMDRWNETFIKIVIGESPISEYDEFLTWFDNNGGTELTAEANELYELSFRQ